MVNYESTYGTEAIRDGYKSAGQRVRYACDILNEMEENQRREERQQRWCFGFLMVCMLAAVAAANYGGL